MSPNPAVSMGMGASFIIEVSARIAAGYTAGLVIFFPSKISGDTVEAKPSMEGAVATMA